MQPAQHYDEYEQHAHEADQQQQAAEEEMYEGEETLPSRTQQTAFTFKTSHRPARSRVPSYTSSSSSHATLTPTSMAAFDPLTTPATKAAASRAITKRSSLSLPSPRPAQPLPLPAPSSDPFDGIDPSPPSYHDSMYEQVLASDDVIAAQFSGMLALEPPAAVDAAHIRRAAQQDQRELEQQEVEEEVNAMMSQIKRPARAARQKQRAAVQAMAEEEEYVEEEVKRSAPLRRQHPRYAMSNEEEEEAPGDVQQVQRPIPKTVQRVARTPRRQVRQEEEAEGDEQSAVVARPQQSRVARKRQPVVQRQEQLDVEEEYEEPPPARSQVKRPVKKAAGALEEKTVGRSRRVESMEWFEEHEDRKEVRGGQRRVSADATTASAPVRNAELVRRSVAADDTELVGSNDRQLANGKSEKRSHNKPVAARTLSASPHTRPTALSSSASSSSSTKPYRPRRIKIDALAFMQSGTPFLKYSSSYFSSPPHFRQFILVATTPAYIQWFSQNKPLSASRVYLESVTAITTGQATATFAKHKAAELESMSFSVLYGVEGGRERSLDLTAKDKNELNVWVKGLARLVKLVKQGEELDAERNWKRLLIELPVVYGGNGSASQPLIDAESGQIVEVRGRSTVKGGGSAEVESSLYRDLQPRLQRLEALLQKRKDEVKSAKGTSVYTVVREKVKRVEVICRLVGDALMDGQLEEADQQLWLGSLELDTVNDMIASAKSER